MAERHSSRVRQLKRLMLAGSVIATAILLVIGIFDPFHHFTAVFAVDKLGIEGTRVTMGKPRVAGFRQDGRPYVMHAEAMTQDLRQPTTFSLKIIDSVIGLADKSSATVTADSGVYDNTANSMDLRGSVHVKNDSGYEAFMSSAHIDFKSSAVHSSEPVKAILNTTTVTADALEVRDSGKTVVFSGHVKSLMLPAKEAAETAGSLKGTTP